MLPLIGHPVFSSLKSNACLAQTCRVSFAFVETGAGLWQAVPWPATGCLSAREIYNAPLVLTIVLGGLARLRHSGVGALIQYIYSAGRSGGIARGRHDGGVRVPFD
jgi:hypothetical protein